MATNATKIAIKIGLLVAELLIDVSLPAEFRLPNRRFRKNLGRKFRFWVLLQGGTEPQKRKH